jgi:hypothetical protein
MELAGLGPQEQIEVFLIIGAVERDYHRREAGKLEKT